MTQRRLHELVTTAHQGHGVEITATQVVITEGHYPAGVAEIRALLKAVARDGRSGLVLRGARFLDSRWRMDVRRPYLASTFLVSGTGVVPSERRES